MIDDFALYLKNWKVYYQHSVWLIKGSKWQPGILAIFNELGPEGQPIANQLDKITRSYDQFETS